MGKDLLKNFLELFGDKYNMMRMFHEINGKQPTTLLASMTKFQSLSF